MKVIFLSNVPRIGKRDEVKEVNTGYAQNFLFPRKLAVPATDQALLQLNKDKNTRIAEKSIQEKLLEKTIETLSANRITIKKKSNDKGHFFSKFDVKEILDAVDKELKIKLTKDMVELKSPITTVGEHTILVHANGKKTEIVIEVESIS